MTSTAPQPSSRHTRGVLSHVFTRYLRKNSTERNPTKTHLQAIEDMHRQRPQLKNGVDLQLQSAFFDGNWPTAIRLADKRAKALKDQYYEVNNFSCHVRPSHIDRIAQVVKVVCEGQIDDPVAKLAAVNAVKQYLKDGTVVKDSDGLDLLEWATEAFFSEDEYPETLGPLRVRAVKASPKERMAGAKNLESCLMHWDLTSAQQVCRCFAAMGVNLH